VKCIDAHQHFWKYNPQKHNWINAEMQVLKRDYLPVDLEALFTENQVEGCISVQADQSEEETFFLLDLANKYAFILGVVGWIDLRAPDLEEKLDSYAKFLKLCGLRHVLQDEKDPEFILKKSFQRGISYLEKYGYTYDILIFPNQMKAALETVQNFPNQKFIIDHIAKPYIKDQKISGWAYNMRAFAECENVWCKVSGMITEADWNNWRYTDLVPYIDVVFEAFGTDRVLFGSDWPVCLLAGSYKTVKGILEIYTRNFSKEEKAKIWGLNALEFYNIRGN
jgi:L-fuconolactonase